MTILCFLSEMDSMFLRCKSDSFNYYLVSQKGGTKRQEISDVAGLLANFGSKLPGKSATKTIA